MNRRFAIRLIRCDINLTRFPLANGPYLNSLVKRLNLYFQRQLKSTMAESKVGSTKHLVRNEADDDGQPTAQEQKSEKRKITKNVFIVSFGFLFLFTAFQSLQNLQSSLNKVQGLGLASLSVIYAALILSSIFVPPFMIGRLGCKWSLVLSMTGYVLYTVCNYYARWWTLIPASIIIGKLFSTWY